MAIITIKSADQNSCSVTKIVIETLCQTLAYPVSVTYDDGKSFDVTVPAGDEANAMAKFKRLAPDATISKGSKAEPAKTESVVKESCYRVPTTDIDLATAEMASKAYGIEVIADGDSQSIQFKGDDAAVEKCLSDLDLKAKATAC